MHRSLVGLVGLSLFLSWSTAPAARACDGDCGGDGAVTVDEVVTGVNLALGLGDLSQCAAFDRDASGAVTVDEIIAAVTNALQGCAVVTPAATPTATATATPGSSTGPTLPNPRPTPAQGCGGGYAVVETSNISPGNNSYVGFAPAELSKVEGALATITPTLFSLGSSGVTCPNSIDSVVRLFTLTIGGANQAPQAGTVYRLKPGFDFSGAPSLAQFDYLEQIPTQAFAGRGWRAQSGTATVESLNGDTLLLRISAEMAAERQVFPVGSEAPVGTFHLEAVWVVDQIARR